MGVNFDTLFIEGNRMDSQQRGQRCPDRAVPAAVLSKDELEEMLDGCVVEVLGTLSADLRSELKGLEKRSRNCSFTQ